MLFIRCSVGRWHYDTDMTVSGVCSMVSRRRARRCGRRDEWVTQVTNPNLEEVLGMLAEATPTSAVVVEQVKAEAVAEVAVVVAVLVEGLVAMMAIVGTCPT